MHVAQGEDLGNLIASDDGTGTDADGHDDQADTEDGVQLADDLINRQEGRDEEVSEHDGEPEILVGKNAGGAAPTAQISQQAGGADSKHNTNHEQQHGGEHTHDLLHGVAHVHTGQFGNAQTLMPHGHKAGSKVMDAAGKDGTEPSLDFSDSNFVGAHQMARSKAVGASLLYMLIVLPIAVKVNKIIYSLSNILSYMSKRFGQ